MGLRLTIRRSWALLLIALGVTGLLGPTLATAATIRVARDGSGDFIVLAEAVASASSGDTVSIAPGVYPEVPDTVLPGGIFGVSAFVTVSELTIIGDDANSVTIGPETPAADLERGPLGIAVATGNNITVQHVTIRNVSFGVNANGDWAIVEDCNFDTCFEGVASTLTGYTTVRRSTFRNTEDSGVQVFSIRGATGALIENCLMVNCGLGADLQPANCEVRDTRMEGGVVGLQVSFGGSCVVTKCTFESNINAGLAVTGGAQVWANNCRFTGTTANNLFVSGYIEGSGNVFSGGSWATISFDYPSELHLHGNHILNAGGWTVNSMGGLFPYKTQDFSGNYWGTADENQIKAWIFDANDDDDLNHTFVEFMPFAEQPVPTENSSFGELKAGFGRQN